MSFIEFNPDFSKLIKVLERVAISLEKILYYQYQVRSGHLLEAVKDPNPHEKESVDYASDEATVKEALEKLESRGIRNPSDRMVSQSWEEPFKEEET